MALVCEPSSLGTLCWDTTFEQLTGVRGRIIGCGPNTAPGRSLVGDPALRGLFGITELCLMSQVHGCTIREAPDWIAAPNSLPEGDALLVRVGDVSDSSRAYGIKTADCLSLLIVAGDWVALVHAGWRGLAAGIVQQVIHRIASRSAASDLHILVGPHALQESYEVGSEVLEAFLRQGVVPVYAPGISPERHYFSLQDTLIGLVNNQTAMPVHWYPTTINTITDHRFHSHRRDSMHAGRNVTILW